MALLVWTNQSRINKSTKSFKSYLGQKFTFSFFLPPWKKNPAVLYQFNQGINYRKDKKIGSKMAKFWFSLRLRGELCFFGENIKCALRLFTKKSSCLKGNFFNRGWAEVRGGWFNNCWLVLIFLYFYNHILYINKFLRLKWRK